MRREQSRPAARDGDEHARLRCHTQLQPLAGGAGDRRAAESAGAGGFRDRRRQRRPGPGGIVRAGRPGVRRSGEPPRRQSRQGRGGARRLRARPRRRDSATAFRSTPMASTTSRPSQTCWRWRGSIPTRSSSATPHMTNSAPLGRVVGRWITHVCVWIETLSLDVRDTMCGLRVYPMAAVAALLDRGGHIGQGMDFDIEIIVRLHRGGTPVVSHPVSVTYPPGNLSNFRMWRDNWQITKMHTRLMVGTLVSSPIILWTAVAPRRHGDALGGLWRARNVLGIAGKRLGLSPAGPPRLHGDAGTCRALLLPHGGEPPARVARLSPPGLCGRRPVAAPRMVGRLSAFPVLRPPCARQFRRLDGPDAGRCRSADGGCRARGGQGAAARRGVHRLAPRQCRGLAGIARRQTRQRVVVLTHTRHAENYNRMLREFNPEAAVNMLQVTEMGPDTAIMLSSGSKTATGCSSPAIARRSAETGGPASRHFSARTPNSPRGHI